ncbi:MAG: CHASE3 domain-containing protein [Rhodoferax sp.]|nr:CHASE3 domain-containing protein [Rhodoferax sp.]
MKVTKKFVAWLGTAVLLLALAVAASFWAFQQIEESARARKEGYIKVNNAADLLVELNAAESGQRGYILTGDETFLAPYLALQGSIPGHMTTLRQLAMTAESHKQLDTVVPLVEAKLAEMRRGIDLRRSQGTGAALAVVASGTGQRLMDAIRTEMNRFIQIEEAALVQHDTELQFSLRRLFTFLVAASALALLSVPAFAYMVYKSLDQQVNNRVHRETQHLLQAQQQTNRLLQIANAALQEGKERLSVTLNSMGDAVIATDANARVTLLNAVAERLTGWTQEQASGLIVDKIFCIVNKETRRAAVIPVMNALTNGTVQGMANHTVLIARDGREFDIADSCAPIRDSANQVIGSILVFRDVTKEYAVQHALDAQNEELRLSRLALDASLVRYFDLYDLAPVGYCTVNADGLVLEANTTASSLLGLERGALVQQTFVRFVAKNHLKRFKLLSKTVFETSEPQTSEIQMLKVDGSQLWVALAFTLARTDGVSNIRVVISDISGRRRAEVERSEVAQALQDKNVELESARALAEKANRAKSDFLSSMSHELRTPLGAILGFAQLIDSGSPQPTLSQKRSVDQILKAGWYLLELINEILDLALIESGRLSLSLEAVSLLDISNECETMIEPQAQQRGIRLDFIPLTIPYNVYGDRTRIKQVLVNLLSNAIKYNTLGGLVKVEATLQRPGIVRVSVTDTGAGLAPDFLAQLFQPFNRLGQKGKIEEGTGIGLVVCKRLVELMHGHIGVESTVGQGSTFWFELSLTTQAQVDKSVAGRVSIAQMPVHSDAPQYTLLYIEDNPANLMLVEDLISRRPDIRLLSATDGITGVELARSARPNVILMDINLPGISGLQALAILAKDDITAHIPVIALSANAIPRDIEKGLKAGFFRYLTKPIKINEFTDALNTALRFSATHPAHTTQKEPQS